LFIFQYFYNKHFKFLFKPFSYVRTSLPTSLYLAANAALRCSVHPKWWALLPEL